MALTIGRMLRRGVAAACPICGAHGAFHHWVRMDPTCPRCGLVFKRTDGHWLGSWFLNICASQILVTVIMFVGFTVQYPNLEWPLIAVLAGSAAILAPIIFFPSSRMLWTAIDLAMRPLDFDDGVAPGWELDGLDEG